VVPRENASWAGPKHPSGLERVDHILILTTGGLGQACPLRDVLLRGPRGGGAGLGVGREKDLVEQIETVLLERVS